MDSKRKMIIAITVFAVAILAIVLLFPYGLQAQFGFRDESEQKVAGEVSKIGQTLYNIDK